MSGVWVFKDGVAKLVANPQAQRLDGGEPSYVRRKVLVYCATNETITSYEDLEDKLLQLGWGPYNGGDRQLRQYHKSSSIPHLISLPVSFSSLKTMHMYDVVVKTRSAFEVRDATIIPRPRHPPSN